MIRARQLLSRSAPRRAASTAAAGEGLLAGVRVLDLTRVLAGPYATQVLGDYGAEVVKVENPRGGDETRAWGPPFAGSESAYFMCVNRNKKSVAVDLKAGDNEGAALVRRLAREADVLLENFRPGQLARFGLDYETLRRENPRLVYGSISGFGADGPMKDRPGYDLLVSAAGGLMGITGHEATGPAKVGVAVTDLLTGLYVHGAVLAALYARERTGEGQRLDTSLLEVQVAALANVGSNYLVGGVEGRRHGTAHENIVPYQAFETRDGHLVVAVGNNRQFGRLCSLLGRPDLAEDPRYADNALRVKNREALVGELSRVFAGRRTDEWLEIVPWEEVPVGPINSLAQVFADPQVRHRGMIEEVEHPTAGRVRLAGIPVKFSRDTPGVRLPPPTLGQHTHDVLGSWLGLGAGEVARLERDGVVATGAAPAV